MKAWEEYAFITNGIVQNIAVFAVGGYTDANIMGSEVFGKDCVVINVSQIPTAVGDIYKDGNFYRVAEDGTQTIVPTIPTEEESVNELLGTTSSLQDTTAANTTAIDDILVMLLDDSTTTE